EQSLDDYDEGNETEQQRIFHIISNAANAMNPDSIFPPQQNLSATSSTGASQVQTERQLGNRNNTSSFQHKFLTTNQFYNCSVVFNVGPSGCSSPLIGSSSPSE
ncbi:hypothetical protein OS493_040653, partial [Desmophyllum pertusum]